MSLPGRRDDTFWRWSLCALLAIFWLLLAHDSRLHWDEPSFLAIGSYSSTAQILEGRYQPSGVDAFTHARIGHLLLVKAIASMVGPGPPVLYIMTGLYLGLLVLGGFLLARLLARLVPDLAGSGTAVMLAAFSPLAVYIAFKTMPEAPAWVAMIGACLALLHAASNAQRRRQWIATCAAISLCLLVTVLTKSHFVLIYATFAISVAVWAPPRVSRPRLFSTFLLSGVASLAAFAIALRVMGIPLASYLSLFDVVTHEKEPVAALMFNVALEAGVLFVAIPLAFLSQHRRETKLFLSWFLLTTVPIVLLLQSVETRYLMSNLPALAGLIWLAVDGLRTRLQGVLAGRQIVRSILAASLLLGLGVQTFVAQKVMAHEIDREALDGLVDEVVERSDPGSAPLIITSWEYSLYNYLRLMRPGLSIYSGTTPELAPPAFTPVGQDGTAYFTQRSILDRQALERAMSGGRKAVLITFTEALPIRNLRQIARIALPAGLERRMDDELNEMSQFRHDATSWIWNDVSLQKTLIGERGPYRAWRID